MLITDSILSPRVRLGSREGGKNCRSWSLGGWVDGHQGAARLPSNTQYDLERDTVCRAGAGELPNREDA